MAAVYGDDFVFDFDDFSDFEENSSDNEEELDEVDDEEVESEDELPFCPCGLANTNQMIACEASNPKCPVQWYHYSCAGITTNTIPKGKWICQQCKRGKGVHKKGKQSALGVLPVPSTPTDTANSSKVQPPASTSANDGESSKRNNKQKKRQRISKRPRAVYTAADVAVAGMDHFSNALEQFASDQLFSIGLVGKNAQRLSTHILEHIQDASIIEFVNFASKQLWNVATAGDIKGVTAAGQDHVYAHFHSFVGGEELRENWNNMLATINARDIFMTHSASVLLHGLMTSWLSLLIKERNATDYSEDQHETEPVDEPALDSHEQQAIMYVAGYIPFSLLKMYKKLAARGNRIAQDYVALLESWQARDDEQYKEHGFMNYVEWIELTNRGGLFKPSPNFFIFCRCAEGVAQKTINDFTLQTLRDCNVKDIVLGKLIGSSSVERCWEKLGSKLPLDQSQVLKKKVDNG